MRSGTPPHDSAGRPHACAGWRMSRFGRLFGFGRAASRGVSWSELRDTTFTVVKAGCYIHVFREYVLEYSVVRLLQAFC